MKILHLTPTERKILEMALKDDDRVQQHYHFMFGCHYLPDIIQHLRRKLEKFFRVEDGKKIFATEIHKIVKIDGKKASIGIYRIVPEYKNEIAKQLKINEAEGGILTP
jgi:hypothetical protein